MPQSMIIFGDTSQEAAIRECEVEGMFRLSGQERNES